jgi:uncharacterized membrane protein YgdD (TMEM256/DUF423 family)
MNWLLIGAVSGFLGVALGAFGAHGLPKDTPPQALEWWKTAAQYHLVHALALLLTGLAGLHGVRVDVCGWCFLAGTLIFSGTLYAMTLGAPRFLGAVTPIGGVLLLAGWVALALAARSLAGRP